MLNYYRRYLPGIATTLEPLHKLLRKCVKWTWGTTQQKSFDGVKQLCSADVLVHYYPNKELILHCDVSPYGIGAILSHIMDDNSEKRVAYMSHTPTPSQRNYSQIDREALAIIEAIKKFHQYLYHRKFHLLTDHKPLFGLLAEYKPIPSMCTSRIQRWAILLAAYNYKLHYCKGQLNGNADCLSRLPTSTMGTLVSSPTNVLMMDLSNSPVTFEEVQSYSRKDPVISKVIELVLNKEKDQTPVKSSEFNQYSTRIHELSVEDKTLLWGHRVIIPSILRSLLLEELHQAHPGANRMKTLARSYVWWPGIEGDIEKEVKNCASCQ